MEKWVLDATMGFPFCFCPIEGDLEGNFSIITGMNLLADVPPGELVAIVHADGQDAVDEFCETYKDELDSLYAKLRKD